MINGKKVLALIPARGGSKGLPNKNLKNLAGKPLIAWSIEQAKSCPEIDLVVVSTDSVEISKTALAYGASVPFIRPPELATDTATSSDVILHAIDFLEKEGNSFDIILLLEPTSPLREGSDISGALNCLVSNKNIESVVGVSQIEGQHPSFLFRINQGLLTPYLDKAPNHMRRQDLDDLYFLEGSVYASYVSAFKIQKGFYHKATAPWKVSRYKSIEIDEAMDLVIAEAILTARAEGRIE